MMIMMTILNKVWTG